jgi:hypothetical protein
MSFQYWFETGMGSGAEGLFSRMVPVLELVSTTRVLRLQGHINFPC